MPHSRVNKRLRKYKYQSCVVPGWFTLTDHEVFVAINTIQEGLAISGNLLEIGTFCGKSGSLLSLLANADETVNLLDLFDNVKNEKNLDTTDYRKMTKEKARKNLDKFGDRYNLVVGNSLEITSLVPVTPHRFIHIDGSHQYEVLKKDLLNAKKYLMEGGVIIVDDYRNFQYPGVGRAFWEFVENHKMFLVCATSTKAYITGSNLSLTYKKELINLSEKSNVKLRVVSGGEDEFVLIHLQGYKRVLQKLFSMVSVVNLKLLPIQIV